MICSFCKKKYLINICIKKKGYNWIISFSNKNEDKDEINISYPLDLKMKNVKYAFSL